jgi:hypothetical protein
MPPIFPFNVHHWGMLHPKASTFDGGLASALRSV